MRKLISSVLAVVAMLVSGTVKADNITLEQAKEASAYFLGYVMDADKLSADDLQLVYLIDNPDLNVPALYIFNASCGWIIMAGTTVNDPVIAYSATSTLDIDNISPSMWWWLKSYAADIMEVQAMDAENDYPDCPQWQDIANRKLSGSKAANQIILSNAVWNQGDENNPTYNKYCPQASDGRYSVVGCVATALSQMCYYYHYPKKPTGSAKTWFGSGFLRVNFDTVSYDYSLMADRVKRSSGSDTISEVAKLSYHMGLAVQMSYSPDGSGSNHLNAKQGMTKNYKYKQPTLMSRQGTDDTAFVNSIYRELVKKNVIYMGGVSSTGGGVDADGHAWLVIGYETDNDSWMYFNWGWGGSGNGWFNLRTNNMRIGRQGYNFDTDQTILLGLVPPADSIMAITNVEGHTILGTPYPNPAALSVYLPYNVDHTSTLEVYSIDGKLVTSRRVDAGTGELELNVVGMPAGIYIYRLNSQNGKFIVR